MLLKTEEDLLCAKTKHQSDKTKHQSTKKIICEEQNERLWIKQTTNIAKENISEDKKNPEEQKKHQRINTNTRGSKETPE